MQVCVLVSHTAVFRTSVLLMKKLWQGSQTLVTTILSCMLLSHKGHRGSQTVAYFGARHYGGTLLSTTPLSEGNFTVCLYNYLGKMWVIKQHEHKVWHNLLKLKSLTMQKGHWSWVTPFSVRTLPSTELEYMVWRWSCIVTILYRVSL